MTADVLAAAVPDLRSAEQLPTARGVPRYAVLTPDGRTVLVSVDSPDAISRFRQLVAVAAIGAGVLDLLAAGVRAEHGFVVQPMPVELPAEGTRSPAEVESLLRPVSEALAALHAAGMCLGALAVGSLSLAADGGAVIADLLAAVPIGTRVRGATLARYAGGLPSAPELGDGRPLTAATDVFGLAAVILTLLTGSGGWLGNPAAALRSAGLDGTTLLSALAIDPAARPAGVPELMRALTEAPRLPRSRPASSPAVAPSPSMGPSQPQPSAPRAAGAPSGPPPPSPPQTGELSVPPPQAGKPTVLPPSQPEPLAVLPLTPAPWVAAAPTAGLPVPPPIRSRLLRAAVEPQPTTTAPERDLPVWQSEIDAAAEAVWGAVDRTAATLDRPDLRFRPATELGQLAEDPTRSMWRSPVVLGSIVATVLVLVVALVLMLG